MGGVPMSEMKMYPVKPFRSNQSWLMTTFARRSPSSSLPM